MYLKNRNTILNYVRFCIPSNKLNKHYININKKTQFILYTNNIKVVDSVGKIFLNEDNNPTAFTIIHLLKDESYLSIYGFSDKSKKLTFNLNTKSIEPINHYNSVVDLNKFFTNNYLCILDKI